MMRNEIALHGKKRRNHLARVWKTMQNTLIMNHHTEGLPGPLKVPRRAASLYIMLQANQSLSNDPMRIIDWVNMFALAVRSRENAAGGRVVTAPTNGACGILPASIGILRSLHLAGYTGNYRTLFTCLRHYRLTI